ncbi:MAG: permease [Moraxellaceae bacterium]|nr:MAG: permease [Moraxellaceae bacterium]
MGLEFLVGIVIGSILGLTGAGGSVFAVPMLVYGLQLPAQNAVGISLGAVAVSAFVGVLTRFRRGIIVWAPAGIVAVTGVSTAPLGLWTSRQIPDHFLLFAFSLLVFLIAHRMWHETRNQTAKTPIMKTAVQQSGSLIVMTQGEGFLSSGLEVKGVILIALVGLVTGFLAGLFGVGGGFIIVPTLIILLGLGIHQAIATSLVIILFIGSSGFLSFLNVQDNMPVNILIQVIIGGAVGMVLGTFFSKYLTGIVLQRLFVFILSSVALFTFYNSVQGIAEIYLS